MWLLQLALIIVTCRCCGWLAERLGQARVVGEIAAGILLGPTIFGALSPDAYTVIFGMTDAPGVAQLGEVGLVLLMFQIGMHLDAKGFVLKKDVAAPLSIALLGMAAPFAAGVAVAAMSKDVLAPDVLTVQYVVFCGIALSVSAVPVMARIIMDLGLADKPLAKTALSAVMVTDVVGWIMLAVITSMSVAGSAPVTLLRTVLWLVLYLGLSVAAARLVVRPLLGRAARKGATAQMISLVVASVLVSAWATSTLGFHSAFGALTAAILLRDVPGLQQQWDQHLDGFIRIVLMPVFFAYAGLHASFNAIEGTDAWLWFGAFLACGFVGKFGGSYVGARLFGIAPRESAVIASLMNTRGLMELIVLSIGLELQILPQNVYTILVAMALVTTAMTVPLVRLFVAARSPVPVVSPVADGAE